MSITTIETTITPAYLRNKTKDEIIDHVMRLLRENDELLTACRAARKWYGSPEAFGDFATLNSCALSFNPVCKTLDEALVKYEGY